MVTTPSRWMPQSRTRAPVARRVRAAAALLVLIHGTLLLAPPRAAAQRTAFEDVRPGAYFSRPVSSLAADGVFEGTECGDGLFCPHKPVLRRHMAVWVVRVLDGREPDVSESRFADVDGSDWYSAHIERMRELRITMGCGDGARFCPDRPVSRAEMAVFLARAFKLPVGPDPGFTDVPGASFYAEEVAALHGSGITIGCGDGSRFCPGDDTRRGQMATFLHRAVNRAEHRVVRPAGPLGLDPFYKKYLDAGGLPVVAAAQVSDEALRQAARLVDEMLANRDDLRSTIAARNVRFAIMAESSGLTDLPEFRDMKGEVEPLTGIDWDERVRGGGVGPTDYRPVLVIAEENLLCYSSDVFPNEDIAVHEIAHTILNMGIERQPGGLHFRARLARAYRDSLDAGLWAHTYAATNVDEYWAEGVQSWFGLNDPPGPIHNDINTRDELESYDPNLAALLVEVFGDTSVRSSCHQTFVDDRTTAVVRGTIQGADGEAIEGILIWLWQGTGENSGSGWTDSDGVFAIRVVDGSYTLDVYGPSGRCAGWYDGEGITTNRSEAHLVIVDGLDISGIGIRLPSAPEDLPSVRC